MWEFKGACHPVLGDPCSVFGHNAKMRRFILFFVTGLGLSTGHCAVLIADDKGLQADYILDSRGSLPQVGSMVGIGRGTGGN